MAKTGLTVTVLAVLCLAATLFVEITNEMEKANTLPQNPYSYATLPVHSSFESGQLGPFRLLSTFGKDSYGYIAFQDDALRYRSEGETWVCVRTKEIQGKVKARWVWKPLDGYEFITECWNAYPNQIGHTAIIIFRADIKEICYVNHPQFHVLSDDFDPFKYDWITVEMEVDYAEPQICRLKISDREWVNLPIGDEPIGAVEGFWQLQFYLRAKGTVLIKSIEAW